LDGLMKVIKEKGLHEVMREVNYRGQNILHIAIDSRQFEIAKYLVSLYNDEMQYDLNLQDKTGWGALHYICASGNVDLVLQFLSSNKFDPTLQSTDGTTPLHYLMRGFPPNVNIEDFDEEKLTEGQNPEFHKFSRAVRLLIDKGVDIRAANSNGETVLHSAALAGKAAAIRWLVHNQKWSVDINSTTNYGDSALHLAARVGAVDAVKALLELGADTFLVGENGTPLNVAESADQKAVVDILETWNANTRKRRMTYSDVTSIVDDIFESAYGDHNYTSLMFSSGTTNFSPTSSSSLSLSQSSFTPSTSTSLVSSVESMMSELGIDTTTGSNDA
jgi:hypothetical protein